MENYAAMADFGRLTVVFPGKSLAYLRQQLCNKSDPSKNVGLTGLIFFRMTGNIPKK